MHVDSWMKPVQEPEEPADSTLRGSSLPEDSNLPVVGQQCSESRDRDLLHLWIFLGKLDYPLHTPLVQSKRKKEPDIRSFFLIFQC